MHALECVKVSGGTRLSRKLESFTSVRRPIAPERPTTLVENNGAIGAAGIGGLGLAEVVTGGFAGAGCG